MQDKLDEAFKACRNSLAIRERLAAADRKRPNGRAITPSAMPNS